MCKSGGGGVIGIHDAVSACCRSMLKAAGVYVEVKEPRGVFVKDDGSMSQGGCDLSFFMQGPLHRRTFADVSRVNESSEQSVAAFASNLKTGNAAEARARSKRAKFEGPSGLLNTFFIPLTLEVGGYVGKDLRRLISDCAKMVKNIPPAHAPFTASTFYRFWLQQLSLVSSIGAVRHGLRRLASVVRVGVGGVGGGVARVVGGGGIL